VVPGVTRRKARLPAYSNFRVEDGGRVYRVCLMRNSKHTLVVALKCSAGGERLLDPFGRRGRALTALAREVAGAWGVK